MPTKTHNLFSTGIQYLYTLYSRKAADYRFYKLKNMHRLIQVKQADDIPTEMQNTPPGLLLEYHNLKRPFDKYTDASLLVGTCMDNRVQLRLPPNFAYIIRTAGARMEFTGFDISFAVAMGGIRYMTLIGHTQCGMAHVRDVQVPFVRRLVENGGWETDEAAKHFAQEASRHETADEIAFTLAETRRLQTKYPKLTIAPMLYKVEDRMLYLIDESVHFTKR